MRKATTFRPISEYVEELEPEIKAHGGLAPYLNVLLYNETRRKKLEVLAASYPQKEVSA